MDKISAYTYLFQAPSAVIRVANTYAIKSVGCLCEKQDPEVVTACLYLCCIMTLGDETKLEGRLADTSGWYNKIDLSGYLLQNAKL